jgi:hypothetical protein
MPGSTKPVTDRGRQRIPKMTTLIVRNYPPRAQNYVAERLQREGWFDEGWTAEFPRDWRGGRFADGKPMRLRVGSGTKWSQEAWREAHQMWKRHGEHNHLLLDGLEEANLRRRAARFMSARGMQGGEMPPELTDDERADPEMVEAWKAYSFLHWYGYYRRLSNFPHFYFRSQVEMQDTAATARKRFYEAERLLGEANRQRALQEYEKPDALRAWKQLMATNPDFRGDSYIQEDSYEIQSRYLELFRELPSGRELKQRLALQAFLGQAGAPSPGAPDWLPLAPLARPHLLPDLELKGPLDELIGEAAVNTVLARKGLLKAPQAQPAGPGLGGPAPQPAPDR